MIKRIINSPVFKNSVWLFILQFANMVLPLLTIPYVTRVLGARGYGEYSIAYNWITYFQVIVEYGFAFGGARKIAISDELSENNRVFSSIITARFGLFALCVVLFNLIAIFHNISKSLYIDTMILMVVVFSVVFQANWIFQGKQQMKYLTIINVIGRVISVILILLFVKRSEQVWLYCVLYSFTFIFSSLLGIIIASKRYGLKYTFPGLKPIKDILVENFPLFTSVAVSRLFGSVGITILSLFASESIVGGYSAVYKIPYILTLCFFPLSQALFPFLSQRFAKEEVSALMIQRKIGVIVVGFFCVIGLVITIGKDFIVLKFLGNEYIKYAQLIYFLIPQMILGIVNNFLGIQTLVAKGLQKKYTLCILLSVALIISMNFALCPLVGEYGTACAALVSEGVLTVSLFIMCRKYVYSKVKEEII